MNYKGMILTTIATACLAHGALAAAAAPAPAAPVPAQTADVDSNWYINVGAKAYKLNLPAYFLPATQGKFLNSLTSETKLAATNVNSSTNFMPTLGIGFRVNNAFLTSLFGTRPSIEWDYSQLNHTQFVYSDLTPMAGTAFRNVPQVFPPYPPFSPISSGDFAFDYSKVRTAQQLRDTGIYFKGNKANAAGTIVNSPSIGVVYTGLNQNFTYLIRGHDAVFTDLLYEASGHDRVDAKYYGLSLGDKLDLKFADRFSWFVDASMQILKVNAKAVFVQLANRYADDILHETLMDSRVTASRTGLAYRGQLDTGISYYFSGYKNPHSVKISLSGGIDQWSAVPQIEYNRNGPDGGNPMIRMRSMRNYYSGLELSVPID